LHRLGIQAFNPYIVKNNALQVHPLICTAYNADFDGDQMSIHLPISPLSITEMFKLMQSTSNLLLFSNNSLKLKPSQDLILGLIYLTIKNEYSKNFAFGNYFSNFEEFLAYFYSKKLNMHTPIWFELKPKNLEIYFKDKTTFQKFNNKKYLRVTPGRLIFNNIFNNL
jgi:DNA-directed RNA polymerase subunit beta'